MTNHFKTSIKVMQKLKSTLEFKFSLFLETHILEEAMTMYENFKRQWFMDRGMYRVHYENMIREVIPETVSILVFLGDL